MRIFGVAIAALWFGVCVAVRAQGAPSMRWECPSQPIEPCFKHHGRLSSQNGIALKLWLIGTKRVVALDNDAERLPPGIAKYLEMTSPAHSYIYGDFEICPTEPDEPGHMRRVCVAGAQKLVVRDVGGLKPALRIRSTWPGNQSLRLFERWP